MKIGLALRETHDAESELTAALLRIGERHKVEHDVFHMSRTLSGWSREHLRRLAEQAARFGIDLEAQPDEDGGLLATVREKGSELIGRRPEPGVLLLRDVRELHLAASRTSLAWTMLGLGAQAIFDEELLGVVTASHPQTLRTLRWTVQKVKEAAPQVLAG